MRVEWTVRARSEFLAVVAWLGERSPAAALRLDADVKSAEDRMAEFPNVGSPTLRAGARVLVLARWHKLVVYRVRGEVIEILAFRDGRRSLRDD